MDGNTAPPYRASMEETDDEETEEDIPEEDMAEEAPSEEDRKEALEAKDFQTLLGVEDGKDSKRSRIRAIPPGANRIGPPPRPRTDAVHYNVHSGRYHCNVCLRGFSHERTLRPGVRGGRGSATWIR